MRTGFQNKYFCKRPSSYSMIQSTLVRVLRYSQAPSDASDGCNTIKHSRHQMILARSYLQRCDLPSCHLISLQIWFINVKYCKDIVKTIGLWDVDVCPSQSSNKPHLHPTLGVRHRAYLGPSALMQALAPQKGHELRRKPIGKAAAKRLIQDPKNIFKNKLWWYPQQQ